MSERQKTSCLPDRLVNFTSRVAEIENVITSLLKKEIAVVSLHGGPGFGKTAIAIEVSHKLSEDHDIPVVFSQLTTATNEDKMVRQLCLDIGVNLEGEDPMSSLILWLRNIDTKVIFVMDDIDNLLDDTSRHTFYHFVRLLRKNSNQQCQIVTTSRTSYEIRELVTYEVNVEEMDDDQCMELMRKQCSEQNGEFLRKLAELCGKIPLAMCIACSRVNDFEDPNELLQHLEEQPMRALECPKTDEYVYRAINMSYKKCSDEEKETLVRLAVFEGSFNEEAAQAVIEKEKLETKSVLKNLLFKSLIKQPRMHRYSIHLLIKHFLVKQQEGENEIAERAMVKYYLKLGHDLTMKSYSKDGYKESRETLKQEAHNIQNVLNICCQQNNPTTSDCLAQSKVYTTSPRHFSLFVRTIIPDSIVVDKFLGQCAYMAKDRKQHGIKINLDLLLAEQERIKSINKSDIVHFTTKMKEIETAFKTHHDDIKENMSLCAHYYYQYGRYLSRKSEEEESEKRLELQLQARTNLENSLKLRETLTSSSVGKADKVFSLLQLGNACKLIFSTEYYLNEMEDYEKSSEKAKEYYLEAIRLSQNDLGDHELTSSCHKSLGDFLLKIRKPKEAEKAYKIAKKMRENLKLDASERHLNLLRNFGQCLQINDRINDAIEILESARDMAEKFTGSNETNDCKTKIHAPLAIAYDSKGKISDAKKYAQEALKNRKAIHKTNVPKLVKIISKQHEESWRK